MARDRSASDAVRITSVASSRAEEQRGRQRRYLFSMSLRTLCFVGAILTRHVAWLWPILIAGALVLPYIAVVMANAVHTRGEDLALLDVDHQRPELPSGTNTGPGIGSRG
jgi:Protein of unknown function (DUF3099)